MKAIMKDDEERGVAGADGAPGAEDNAQPTTDSPWHDRRFRPGELIPLDELGDRGTVFAKSLLALLGAFSAPAVYRISARLVSAVEAIVRATRTRRSIQPHRAALRGGRYAAMFRTQ
jgi:hypothetical protein